MREDEEATVRTLTTFRSIMSRLIEERRGRVVDTPGDNLLARFASAVDATLCAAAIQEALKSDNAALPADQRMQFRIGVNLSDVIVDRERIYGNGVNVAARIESLAEAGGISISGTVYEADGTTPVPNADVWAEQDGNGGGGTFTKQDGTYMIEGLAPGDYLVFAEAPGFAGEFYPGTLDENSATLITVTAGADAPEIDFTLELGGTISGTVYEADGSARGRR